MYRILFFALLLGLSLQSCVKTETITYQAQLKEDTTSIRMFLKSNDIQATKLSTGVWYAIDSLANGVYPVLTDSVKLSYSAKIISSLEEVDNVVSKTFSMGGSISGLQQALILFPANSYGRIYIPSGLAFGASAHLNIPPNSNLVYDIKLISVTGTRLATDITTIESYLQSHSIAHQIDPSGIRYTMDQVDTSVTTPQKPVPGDSILVTYTGKLLNADTLLTATSSPIEIALNDQITAWRIMLPQYLAEGSTMTLYVPSGYGYGSSAKEAIPANSNLVYQVTLIKVIHP